MLSPRQFGQLSGELRSQGGFTVHAQTGERPTSGIMVSDVQGEQRTPLRTTRGKDIQSYAREHEAHLTAPNKYLGGWAKTDEPPHQAVLDRSTRYPESDLGRSQAFVNTVANRQEANYTISSGTETQNPAYEKDPVKWMKRIQGQNVP